MSPPRTRLLSSVGFLGASVGAHAAALMLAVTAAHSSRGSLATDLSAETRGEAIGDTFEIPTEAVDSTETAAPSAAGEASPAGPASAPEPASTATPHDATGAATSPPHPHVAAKPSTTTPDGTGANDDSALSTARFGAVGERAAAPLAATFTRGFPQAASADPLWVTAPLGSAGTAIVDLTLDEQGALVATDVSGSGTLPLTEGVRRTLALIRARSFVAAGRVTRLKVTATITPDEVHDGLHGEVFAIGGTFDEGQGNGFFALAVGRRIDIKVQIARVVQ